MKMEHVSKGIFVDRPNRFIATVRIGRQNVRCHMPNPGRMWELLFPGVTVYVRKALHEGRKTAYDVVGIARDNVPILLDTQYNNDTAAALIRDHRIPGWEDWELLRREIAVGSSRFDLLLGRGEERFYLEVKSCTLFGEVGAMFPDAVTARGRRHVLHLAEMARRGSHAGILFLCQWNRAHWFLPDYHTDPDFAAAFFQSASVLDWKALSLRWNEHFDRPEVVRELTYPSAILDRENHDSGDYMLILYLDRDEDILVGALGTQHFPQGYYVYVGSAKRNLAARIARHRRHRKQFHWHIDYLRQQAKMVADIPIRTQDDLEHDLAKAVRTLADWQMDRFGCTDCACSSHLFGFTENPIHCRDFMKMVEDFRINRLGKINIPM